MESSNNRITNYYSHKEKELRCIKFYKIYLSFKCPKYPSSNGRIEINKLNKQNCLLDVSISVFQRNWNGTKLHNIYSCMLFDCPYAVYINVRNECIKNSNGKIKFRWYYCTYLLPWQNKVLSDSFEFLKAILHILYPD